MIATQNGSDLDYPTAGVNLKANWDRAYKRYWSFTEYFSLFIPAMATAEQNFSWEHLSFGVQKIPSAEHRLHSPSVLIITASQARMAITETLSYKNISLMVMLENISFFTSLKLLSRAKWWIFLGLAAVTPPRRWRWKNRALWRLLVVPDSGSVRWQPLSPCLINQLLPCSAQWLG